MSEVRIQVHRIKLAKVTLCIQTTPLDRVIQRRLREFGHVERMAVDRIPHNALHADLKEKETKADRDYAG